MKREFCLLMVLTLIFSVMLTGCGGGTSSTTATGSTSVKAGTYTATEKGLGDVTVTVTVDDKGTITDLKIDAPKETENVGGAAAKKLRETILQRQTVKVDTVAGATYTSKAVIAAVTAALKQAGIDTENMKGKEATAGKDEEVTVDVVVVGAGTSGTGASIAAAEAGAKVLTLEKLDRVGGLATTGMGLLATESSLQKAAGQNVTTEQIFNHLVKYNHYRSNGPLMRAILEKSGDTIDWLMKNGIGLRLGLGIDQKLHIDYPKTYHMWTNSQQDFPKVYEKIQKEYGAQLRLNTRGEELICDQQGNVTGVIAKKEDGGKLTVHAKAVILCTGGFGGDTEAVKEKAEINNYNYFGLGNQGDGVKMAWAVGADKFGDHALQIHLADLVGSKTIMERYFDNAVSQVKDVPLLFVNREGSRFVDEGVVYDNVLWGNAAYSVGGEYFTIVDQASIDEFTKNGIKMTGAYQMNGSGLMTPQGGNDVNITVPPLPNLPKDIETLMKEGNIVYKADTIEELAKATGMNAQKLTKTIETYNKAVETGKDTTFYKKSEYLKYPVKKGPYYAIRVRGSAYATIGGVRINEDIQALKPDGHPIPGLYVAGCDAGGMYDNSYPDLEGLTMCFAMNSGRIAGENAAKLALGK
ncbi:MAG: FAD-binding protein [Clostridiales bacterium]|jgi:fumarate reductase flavoprotein subunit|nr:FAD-binding protein [Eubacteriales bacterium]MDH7565637.1 FAD-binding protein [Clostridiales bacterium]